MIEAQVETGLLPPCDREPSWGCPFWQLHEDEEIEIDDELDEACANYKEAQSSEKHAKEYTAHRKTELLKVLRDRPKVHTGKFRVKYTTFETREKIIPAGKQTRLTVTEVGE